MRQKKNNVAVEANGRVENKRKKTKYPGLDKTVNTKKRWEVLDQDYIDKLNEEEKAWLNKFNIETLGGNFKRNKDGKYQGNLIKKKKDKIKIWGENNSRERCQYSRAKAANLLNDGKYMLDHTESVSEVITKNTEDNLIRTLEANKITTIDFEKEGFVQIETKGGLRWVKKT